MFNKITFKYSSSKKLNNEHIYGLVNSSLRIFFHSLSVNEFIIFLPVLHN